MLVWVLGDRSVVDFRGAAGPSACGNPTVLRLGSIFEGIHAGPAFLLKITLLVLWLKNTFSRPNIRRRIRKMVNVLVKWRSCARQSEKYEI